MNDIAELRAHMFETLEERDGLRITRHIAK